MARRRNPQGRSTSSSEEEHLRYHARSMYAIDAIRKVSMTCIIGFWAWAVIYAGVYLPVRDAPGGQTILTVTQKWIFDANLHVYLAWGAAAGGAGYGWSERRKRLRERGEKDKRIVELEKRLDPNRTTSGLSIEGERQERSP